MPKFFKKDLLTPPHLLDDPAHHGQSPHPQDYFDDPFFNRNPIKELLTWKALSRPYRKKDRSYYTTVAILIILISIIAFMAGEKLLIGALLALGFVVYVLNFVQPEEVNYKLSTQGITIGEHFYHWNELDSFWVSKKDGYSILSVLTHLRFPKVLMLLYEPGLEEQIKKVCARYLPYQEIAPKGLFDKWSESLQKHFPLENPHK